MKLLAILFTSFALLFSTTAVITLTSASADRGVEIAKKKKKKGGKKGNQQRTKTTKIESKGLPPENELGGPNIEKRIEELQRQAQQGEYRPQNGAARKRHAKPRRKSPRGKRKNKVPPLRLIATSRQGACARSQ